MTWHLTIQTILIGLAGTLAALATIGGVCVAFWAKVLKPCGDKCRRVMVAADAVPQLVRDVEEIRGEVRPNGGGSMRDAVMRTDRRTRLVEAQQRARIEADPAIQWYTDDRGEVIAVTAGYTDLTGLDTPGAQLGKWRRAIHPDDLDRVATAWHEAVQTRTLFVCEFRYTHVSLGGSVPCKVTATPVIVDAQVCGWAATVSRQLPRRYEPDRDALDVLNDIWSREDRERPTLNREAGD